MKNVLFMSLLALFGTFATAAEPIHSDAKSVGAWELFELDWNVSNGTQGLVGLITSGDCYVTAVGGGGRTCDVVHTNRQTHHGSAAWEHFKLIQIQGNEYILLTYDDYLVTVVGGGGRNHDVIHTDLKYDTNKPAAEQGGSWERIKVIHWSTGPGGVPQYALETANGNYLTAVNGGGKGWYPCRR
ncbi:fascin domain-containing protein [Acanthopleuribacter pedis]|uniref:Lipocalin-like domain-containing protein n=1 Tax=Acanthopleuribacter pedis TaxID=442870 RepID=A0A8J7Q6G3_9BACT|nr:hypothetical protein [Acanthopleuribacter pedis]MBO1321397.1 hypothetical protein [Acanthopleuribacter pedis]